MDHSWRRIVSTAKKILIPQELAWIGLIIPKAIAFLMLFLVVVSVTVLAATGGHQENLKPQLPPWQLIGQLQITAYRPIAAQTKPECTSRDHCRTSIDDGITKYGAAISQDLLASGTVRYGDVLLIENVDRFVVVNDCMGSRAHRAVDLLVFTHAQEKAVGVRHLKVWLMSAPKTEIAKEIK
jgi:3D (Asp-Asp-Asp) domain-containing protein